MENESLSKNVKTQSQPAAGLMGILRPPRNRAQLVPTGILAKATPTDLLHHLRQEQATTLDLQEVLAQTLQYALTRIGATFARIALLDGEGQTSHLATLKAGPNAHWDYTELGTGLPPQGFEDEVVKSLSPLLIQDVGEDDIRPTPLGPGKPEVRSLIAVPLLDRDQPRGILSLGHSRPRAFRGRDLGGLEAIAEQALMFIENARMHSATKRSLEKEVALSQATKRLGETLEVKELEEIAATCALDLVDGAAKCFLYLLPKGPGIPSLVVRPPEARRGALEALNANYKDRMELVLEGRQALLLNQTSPGNEADYSQTRSAILAPLTHEEGTLGLLILESEEGRAFLHRDLDLATQFAQQTGVALAKARAHQEALQQRAQLEAAIAGAGMGIVILGPGKEVASSNPLAAYLLGWTEGERLTTLCSQVCGYPAQSCPLQRAQALGREGTYREVLVRKGWREYLDRYHLRSAQGGGPAGPWTDSGNPAGYQRAKEGRGCKGQFHCRGLPRATSTPERHPGL